jgi:hypothetical protein
MYHTCRKHTFVEWDRFCSKRQTLERTRPKRSAVSERAQCWHVHCHPPPRRSTFPWCLVRLPCDRQLFAIAKLFIYHTWNLNRTNQCFLDLTKIPKIVGYSIAFQCLGISGHAVFSRCKSTSASQFAPVEDAGTVAGTYGPTHRRVGLPLTYAGYTLARTGQLDDAESMYSLADHK